MVFAGLAYQLSSAVAAEVERGEALKSPAGSILPGRRACAAATGGRCAHPAPRAITGHGLIAGKDV